MSSSRSLRAAFATFLAFKRRFGPQVRAHRKLMISGAVLIVADVFLRLLEPWPLKFVFDNVLGTSASAGTGPKWLDDLSDTALLIGCAAAVVIFAALRALAAYLSTISLALAGSRILTEVRADLYRHVQRLSLRFHTGARTGDLITRLTGDVGRLQEVAVTAALPLVANTMTLVAMIGVMFFINVKLALVAALALPLLSPTFIRRGGQIRTAARGQRKREGAMASVAAEGLSAIKLVQALGLESTLEKTFATENQASLRDGVKSKKLAAGLERKVDVLASLGTALVLLFGAREVKAGALTPGELVVFMFYLKTAFKPMRDLAKYTARLAQASASAERILDLLDEKPEITDAAHAVDAPRFRGELAFEHVTFGYESGRPVLRDVSFRTGPGQVVALVGPSGAGKSSTLGLLLRLYDPADGRVRIDGWDVRDVTISSLRAQFAVVLQGSVLFGVSVRENIAYGCADVSAEQIESAARLANAHEFIASLPDGYETILGERGATLSGGQCQRLAIARAAVRDAPITLLDEPTTGLDEENQRAVNEALRRLTHGRTTIIVAHDLSTIEHADQILYLDAGEIVERGTHAELMALDGAYAAVHRLQSAGRQAGRSLAAGAPGSTGGIWHV
ncbi:MAG: ABC transporter ATP-binding protein [Solirubrobacterales bacterium]|nr:ABC transporter ATP-binding protein [Solirubrobacterales bacterium]